MLLFQGIEDLSEIRSRVAEGDADRVRADVEEPVQARPVEDRPVGRERVLVRRDQDDQAADEEGEDGREERRDDSDLPLRRAFRSRQAW